MTYQLPPPRCPQRRPSDPPRPRRAIVRGVPPAAPKRTLPPPPVVRSAGTKDDPQLSFACSLSTPVHPGHVIADKYRVRRILGRTHGLLIEAAHTQFQQRVVVRLLSSDLARPRELERFRREVGALSRLQSEHAARIIDAGIRPDGAVYLVREYLEGLTLAEHVKRRGPLPLQEAVLLLLQVCEAVQEAHSLGVVLRDLRCSHVYVSRRRSGEPRVKIADFGTAKLLDPAPPEGAGELTATVLHGISAYTSPEIANRRPFDRRADVWSLGCIFYKLLTGKLPFTGQAPELLRAITRQEPVLPRALRADLPPELDRILCWALAKSPAERFESVYAFAHALRPFAGPRGQMLVEQIGRLSVAVAKAEPPSDEPSPVVRLSRRPGVRATEPARAARAVAPARPGRDITPLTGPAVRRPRQRRQPTMTSELPGPMPIPSRPSPTWPQDRAAQAAAPLTPAAQPRAPEPAGPAPAQAVRPGPAAVVPAAATVKATRPDRTGPLPPHRPSLPTGRGLSVPAFLLKTTTGRRKAAAAAVVGALCAVPTLAMLLVLATSGRAPHPTAALPPQPPSPALVAVAPRAPEPAVAPASVQEPDPEPELATDSPSGEEEPPAAGPRPQAPGPAGERAEPPRLQAEPAARHVVPARPRSRAPARREIAEPAAARGAEAADAAPARAPQDEVEPAAPPETLARRGRAEQEEVEISPPEVPARQGRAERSEDEGADDGLSKHRGVIVAAVVGDSCQFAVDGRPRGSGSSLRVEVAPGSHRVSCRTPSGESATRSVAVQAGKSAMAMFRFE
ncbi:MAG: protein kinase [Deltaproteobacteria bacterium]|nr:protein kinase [Deltaproteobacteria bacterium]